MPTPPNNPTQTLIRAFLLLDAVLLRSAFKGRAASIGEASITYSPPHDNSKGVSFALCTNHVGQGKSTE